MVAQLRRGLSQRAVARQARVSLHTVQRWVARAAGTRLDRVEWTDRASIAGQTGRTDPATEALIVQVRRELRAQSDLGEFGADAIHRTLLEQAAPVIPSIRTIGRILARRGVLDARRRIRRPAPPRGWYLPEVVTGHAELDSFDIVEGLQLPDGTEVEVLTATSLHGRLVGAWPGPPVTARQIVTQVADHWRALGLPTFAQFDNDNRFQGPHQHPDAIGRVIRLCLSIGVVPVFAPPREPGLQNAAENFNGRWQEKVWHRFDHQTLGDLCDRSVRFILASRHRAAARYDGAPVRHRVPLDWTLDLQAPLHGRIVFVRRTSEYGVVSLLGRRWDVDRQWCHRLVRCEVCLDDERIRFHGLRRAQPDVQPLLREMPYQLPAHRFRE